MLENNFDNNLGTGYIFLALELILIYLIFH